MRNVLFLNLTRHSLTPTSTPKDMFVKRIDEYAPLDDPSDAVQVWDTAQELIVKVEDELKDALSKELEIIVALPGTSLLAATLAVGLWTRANTRINLVTATKTREGYVFNLGADKLISLGSKLREVKAYSE